MEVDEIQRLQVCKFQRLISSNGGDISSNPNKIATQKANHHYLDEDGGGGGGGGRLCGWPSSRIVRVSRASGGKDRHSKVLTSKGLRDRRVRLSVTTAIQFYDLQDRLGYDQPSKAVEWLIKAAENSIAELPSLDPLFSECNQDNHYRKQLADNKKKPDTEFEDPNNQTHQQNNSNNNNISVSKSSACSSTSETSKGSGLSLSRSENRIRARERAREMAAKKEKVKEGDPNNVSNSIRVNGVSENSSFTDLLTGGGISSATAVSPNNDSNPAASPESRIQWTTPMDYFFRPPQFNITAVSEVSVFINGGWIYFHKLSFLRSAKHWLHHGGAFSGSHRV
ncbi:hypothetical protein L6452_35700 [Arctium lappa]|uniref:Uncharacterized protein n=1 Tax=Arctium lappa TaxID=4217 RepID=A0ACB8Y788_ARCLA|nr:hypothetical protein L6452_35700 [Arctium lappa]